MINCDTCHEPFTGELLSDVVCDGCHRWVHRSCTDGYILIDVDWDEFPKAYMFCRACDDPQEWMGEQ